MDINKVTFQTIGMDGKDKLNELYDKSALTIEGCSSMNGDEDALRFFFSFIDKECGGWNEEKEPVFYEVSGEVMDKLYGLHGNARREEDQGNEGVRRIA